MPSGRVYVGGLPYGTNDRDIERFFRGYGRIRDVLLKNGYGFIEFDDHRDAEDACHELNGKRMMGERVTVERARGTPRGRDRGAGGDRDRDHKSARERARDKYGPPTRTKYRVIIENLSSRVSWQDLKDYMRKAGEVTYADAHKDNQNEGVVEFATYSDMKNAIVKLDDTELNGRRIKVTEEKSSKSGKRSDSESSRSRSRSPRKSRSRSKSRSKSRSVSKSRSRSPRKDKRSRSRSPTTDKRSRSRTKRSPSANGEASKGRSRSRSAARDSRSRSKSN